MKSFNVKKEAPAKRPDKRPQNPFLQPTETAYIQVNYFICYVIESILHLQPLTTGTAEQGVGFDD